MKVNRKKLLNEIEEIIAYGCAYGEEVDITTAKINAAIEPLVLAVETNKEYAHLQIEKDREETIKLHLLTSNGILARILARKIREREINLD